MAKETSVVSFDPIAEKKEIGIFGRLIMTKWHKGKAVEKSEPYGHYMFCGGQGSGKSTSVLWFAEYLGKKYKKRKIKYFDEVKDKYVKFDTPPKVKFYSNVGLGRHIKKTDIFETIDGFDEYANEVRIVFIDEIHTYFPKESRNKETIQIRDDLVAIFSQLRKRNTYIISTAQVYGRLDKALREQCLYMVACRVNANKKLVNDFIRGDDIICDQLGRWAGNPRYIHVHGLSKLIYDSKKIIRE